MFLAYIVVAVILAALVAGQARRVMRCWRAQAAGWGTPIERSDKPVQFALLFGSEIALLGVAVMYFMAFMSGAIS